MKEIAELRFGLNADEVLDNISVARVYTHDQQIEVVKLAAGKIADDEAPTRMLVRKEIVVLL